MDDFARTVVEHIIARRERGTSISAADQQLVRLWEAQGASAEAITSGIDDAFDRRRDPPRSLKDCGRWIRARIKAEIESDSESWSVGANGSNPSPEALAPAISLEDELLERAHVRARRATTPPVREAYHELYREMDDILLTEGSLDASTISLLDEALVESVLVRLDESESARLRTAAKGGTSALLDALGLPSMLEPDPHD